MKEFKGIQELLKTRFDQEENKNKEISSVLERERLRLGESLKKLQLYQEDIPYVKLFEDKNYGFDKEFFDKEEIYDVIISPINDLLEFNKYKKAFMIKRRNNEVNKIISIDKKVFTTLFYKKEIAECIANKTLIDSSIELHDLKQSCQQKQYYLTDNIIKVLELPSEELQKIKELLSKKELIEKGMTNTQASLSKLLKQRAEFLIDYNKSVADSILPEHICPLCGRESEELTALFFETEAVLKLNLGIIANQLTEIIGQLTYLFDHIVIGRVDDFFALNQNIIEKYNLLSPFLQISHEELSEDLKNEKLLFTNMSDIVDFKLFEAEYSIIIQRLSAELKDETEVISEEMFAKLLRILLEYYPNIEPYDEEILMKKKFYISALFSNTLNLQFKEIESKCIKLNEKNIIKTERYNKIADSISTIIKKYNAANKKYQSSIAKNIAVPLFIFTGRIIQNYPLGLGVLIQVEDNAIVFKTKDMKSDIFNNLSTGQLNGVVISLLLAIKETFTTSKSLNTLLIDDPLQTIDEISAISLIDLLSEHFGDTQIILSTHEDEKQYLLKKKYEQSGKSCMILNMQEKYLSQ